MWGNAIPSSRGTLARGVQGPHWETPPVRHCREPVTSATRGVGSGPLAESTSQAPSCGTSQPCRTSGRKYG
jgi:hypothetical protein